MKEKRLLAALGQVDEQYIEEAAWGERAGKKRRWIKWAALAACLCLVAAGGFAIQRHLSVPDTPSSTITVSEDGVTIPQREVTLSSEGAADMMGFFIYHGRSYVQYEWIYEDVDFIGEYLGTATGMIDEWTTKDGYVELAGSVRGDFYSIKGIDPDFMLCMRYDDGSVATYINDNDITLKTGADLFEARLHLSGHYTAVQYQTRSAWYYSTGELYTLKADYQEEVQAFVDALDRAEFMPSADIPLAEGQSSIYDSLEIYHMYFTLENGMTVHLRIFSGGYVIFRGLNSVCLKLNDDSLDTLIALFESGGAGVLAQVEDYAVSYEDCLNVPDLGAYIPSYIPDGMYFERADIHYEIDRLTAAVGAAKEITVEFESSNGGAFYSVTVSYADAYEAGGWAGPMYDAETLTVDDVADCTQTVGPIDDPLSHVWTVLGIWTDDVIVVLSAQGLDIQESYAILNSVQEVG